MCVWRLFISLIVLFYFILFFENVFKRQDCFACCTFYCGEWSTSTLTFNYTGQNMCILFTLESPMHNQFRIDIAIGIHSQLWIHPCKIYIFLSSATYGLCVYPDLFSPYFFFSGLNNYHGRNGTFFFSTFAIYYKEWFFDDNIDTAAAEEEEGK